jgi:subtilisin family serine protease
MKKILLLFVMAVTVCITCYGQEIQKIESLLKEEMQGRGAEELIQINILMKAQFDPLELRSKASIYTRKEDKRTFVVNELKSYSIETQKEVMSYLNHFAENNSVTGITQFWIYNGINCYATQEVIEALSELDDVLTIGFDRLENLLPPHEDPVPADPTKEITANVTRVNAHLVWALGYRGEGVIVAVLDTGVNYTHNDLASHRWEHPDYPYHGWNFSNNDNNPMDGNGHGTHCAGTVAGNGTAGSQTGMAPDATIMALKVLNNQGSGTLSQALNAFEFAIDHGAHVLSMSFGFAGGGSNSIRISMRNAMVNTLEAGVIASVASGNEGGDPAYPIPNNVGCPGNCPPPWLHPDQAITGGTSAVVCVGATNNSDQIAAFSSRGPVTWQSVPLYNDYEYNPGMGLIRPDVCAPGVNVKSCRHNNNTGYTTMSGTSMATPCVAGVMALMLSKNPNLMPAEISEILETTAVRLPNSASPKGNSYGSGRINAYEAISTVSLCSGPISHLTYTLEYDKVVHFNWNKPLNATHLVEYNIYINGNILDGTFTEESFIFHATEEGAYQLCVEAVHLIEDEYCTSSLVCKNFEVLSICAPVTELAANAGAEVVLSWTAPEPVSEILHYNVFRNGEFVGTVETESFSENMASGSYTYSVETEYMNDCISDQVSIELLVLNVPINLMAKAYSESIELSWEYDNDAILFSIYKDDNNIASNIAGRQFTDYAGETDIEYCYYVKAMAQGLESAPSNEACTMIIGIEEYSGKWLIHPNPTTGELIITGERVNEWTGVEIFDVYGKKVRTKFPSNLLEEWQPQADGVVINISHLQAGIYFLKIKTEQGEIVKKIVKQ